MNAILPKDLKPPSFSHILRTKIIPWSQQNVSERFIIAHPKMRQKDMPYGAQLIPQQLQSKRVLIKNRRSYGNIRHIIAEWPQAGLHELGKYTLVCVLEGYINYQLGSYKIQCGSGYFIFIPPGIPRPDGSQTYADLEKGTSCKIATLLLHPNAVEYWISHADTQAKQSDYFLVLDERVTYLFQALAEEIVENQNKDLHIREGLFSVFLAVLQREIDSKKYQNYRSWNPIESETKDVLSQEFSIRLKEYIKNNLSKNLTIETVATAMYHSPAQFTRVMRRETGKSFNEYLSEYRLIKAKELLCTTQWTVNAIATFVGFKSHRYFRTFFKKHTGLTPTQFRQTESRETNN